MRAFLSRTVESISFTQSQILCVENKHKSLIVSSLAAVLYPFYRSDPNVFEDQKS